MSYTKRLLERERQLGRPVRVGIVGAGQMGSGLIAQVERAKGMTVSVVADIDVQRGVGAYNRAGRQDVTVVTDLADVPALVEAGKAVVINNGLDMPHLPVDVVLEVSGVPEIAAQIALASLFAKKDVALMTVEADITVGRFLTAVAESGQSVYTICRGDEPVEALKLVEYAEDLGLTVVSAGKGKNNPNRPYDVPADVEAEALAKGMNPRMLCEFTDGTKTQLEMAALSNATGFPIEKHGMHGPVASVADLATKLIPKADGGILETNGPVVDYVVEGDVAPGVFVVIKSESDVVTHELDYLKLGKGPYYTLFRPYHLASVEAQLSIAEAVLDRRASFQTRYWTTEVTAVTKTALKAGTKLEGLGGNHFRGWAVPAAEATEAGYVAIALAAGSVLKNDVPKDHTITFADIELDETRPLVAMRRLQDSLVARGIL
ncbi:MAG: oxidoreductase [Propionibacteriaceae bacterium]|nr:oxidoreductase [Micropruina sp.]HBX80797.1 oxidoreductase [Propionibacteriaceae bacterium]